VIYINILGKGEGAKYSCPPSPPPSPARGEGDKGVIF